MTKTTKKLIFGLAICFAAISIGCNQPTSTPINTRPIAEPSVSDAEITLDGSKRDYSSTFITKKITEKNKKVKIEFTVEMAVSNASDKTQELVWKLDADSGESKILASHKFETGATEWVKLSKTIESVNVGENAYIKLDTVTEWKKLKVYLKKLDVKVSEIMESDSEANTNPFADAEYTIDGSASNISWAFFTKNIEEENKKIKVDFSVEMAVENNSDKSQNLLWQVNTGLKTYPIVVSHIFEKGTTAWTKLEGSYDETEVGEGPIFYLATVQDKANLKIYLKNISLTVTPVSTETNWRSEDVPSLKETYKDIFEYFGIATEYGNFGTGWGTPNEFYYEEVQQGIAKHANSITMGNEFKPQFIMSWWGQKPRIQGKYTASNGEEIDTPVLGGLDRLGTILGICKNIGVKMRGHVLVWHSQTDDNFFAEGYEAKYDDATTKNVITNKVTPEVMNARLEWYIKTVLEYVDNWEKTNNAGKHIIWAWDVVNEAMADDADVNAGTWVRGSTAGTKDKNPNSSGSRWYQVYGSQEFIINAFRYANKYAPADVKLCYNDYNEYMENKTEAILKIIQEIKSHENDETLPTRFDVMAMQSHVGATWPGVTGYENALKRYLAAGVDVHVSELDLGTLTDSDCASLYSDYFKMLKKYGTGCTAYSGHKITNVTLWGVNDENSWINPDNNGNKASPLVFTLVDNVKTSTRTKNGLTFPLYDVGDTYKPKDSFWSVINAAK